MSSRPTGLCAKLTCRCETVIGRLSARSACLFVGRICPLRPWIHFSALLCRHSITPEKLLIINHNHLFHCRRHHCCHRGSSVKDSKSRGKKRKIAFSCFLLFMLQFLRNYILHYAIHFQVYRKYITNWKSITILNDVYNFLSVLLGYIPIEETTCAETAADGFHEAH